MTFLRRVSEAGDHRENSCSGGGKEARWQRVEYRAGRKGQLSEGSWTPKAFNLADFFSKVVLFFFFLILRQFF